MSESVVRARKNLKGGEGGCGFPPAEIGLNCCKKLYTVRKKLVDFSLLINFTAKKLSLLCKGIGRILLVTLIYLTCACHSGQMPEQSLRYFPVPHPTHISFIVMCFSVINMWLSSNCFILLHSSTKLALGHQEANNRQYPIDK